MYQWQQVKVMKQQGLSIKKIARKLRLSKNTVRKYLRDPAPPHFNGNPKEKKIAPYVDSIDQMLEKGYIGTRIYRELLSMGYSGSVDSVWRYTRAVKAESRRVHLATTRVETGPGEQMQYDWKEWMLPVESTLIKIYIHSVILSCSRRKHFSFSLSITQGDVIRANEASIFFFGGAARQLLIDNPKQMVISHRKDGVVGYNDNFLKFCGLYGISPSPCQPYRARTKGKVERPFFFVQEHLLRGLVVESLEEFDQKLSAFNEACNQERHSALGESPQDKFQRDEKAHLLPIPEVDPILVHPREVRKVTNDGYIRYRGGYYPVPMRLCLSEVWVESFFGRKLRVVDKTATLVADLDVHVVEDGRRLVHPEHEVLNAGYREKRQRQALGVIERFVRLFGTSGEAYVAGLRQKAGHNLQWHLHEIMTFCQMVDPQEVLTAMEACIDIGAYHKNSVLRLLNSKKPPVTSTLRIDLPLPQANITRDLSAYAVGHGRAEVNRG